MENRSIEAKKGGRPHVVNRQGLYAKVAKFAVAAIDTLVELLHSRNENIQLGAAKVLLDKCLPDLKAVDYSQFVEREPLKINIIAGADYYEYLKRQEKIIDKATA